MLRLITDIEPAFFDSFADHPLQSYAWGEARLASGVAVVRFGWFTGETLTATYQMTVHRIPGTPFAVGYMPCVRLPDDAVCRSFLVYAKRHNLIAIKIEPLIDKKMKKHIVPSLLVPSREQHFTRWTQLLDLSLSEETILAHCSRTTRYDINITRKKGVTVAIENTEEGFAAFSELYFETCKRQGYFGHDMHYHRAVWHAMGKARIAHILVARYRGEPIAATELFLFKDTLYYLYAGSSPEHRDLNAMKMLLFEAIRFGKIRGASTFDLWGSLPPIYKKEHPWAGFTDFKRSFGTQFVERVDSYDLIARPLLYQCYVILYGLRKRVLPLLRKMGKDR